MRLKIDVTPLWWKIEAKNPETFAEWCVKAVRVILSVWPRAEVRLSREKLVAVVTFDEALRVGQALDEKSKIRTLLAAIVGMDDMPPKVSDRKWFDFPGVTVETMQCRIGEDPDLTFREGIPGEDNYVPGDVVIVQGGTGCRVLALNEMGVRWIQRQLEGA